MTAAEALRGVQRIAVDASALIDFATFDTRSIAFLTRLMERSASGQIVLVGSVLLSPEVLSFADAAGDTEADGYRHLLGRVERIAVSEDIASHGAEFRNRYRLTTVDAVHLATAALSNCQAFLTCDGNFRRAQGIPVGRGDAAHLGRPEADGMSDARTALNAHAAAPPLPADRQEAVVSWGRNLRSVGYVYRPSDIGGLRDVLTLAREKNLPVGLRGTGLSYGDASLNRERIGLDITRMNRILEWDPAEGVLSCEPGVTIRDIWRHGIGDGWWPHVVSGTQFPTLAGAAAMNIHGKNHIHAGPIGEHIREFDLLLPSGEIVTCRPEGENADLFRAAIGSFGMLGVFTRITLELKKVHSGLLRVTPHAAGNWADLFRLMRDLSAGADYIVGWADCFASGASAGRGLIHTANYLKPGEDPNPAQTLRADYQDLGDTVLGVVPKSILWRFMKPWMNPGGMALLNNAQYHLGRRKAGVPHLETHAAFAFMLDYVPNWKLAYGPGGLLQYQCFVPEATAETVFRRLLERSRRSGEVPTLSVFKRHRRDDFLMSYALDGYSLALDFKRTRENHDRLMRLFAEHDKDVLDAGGRFYFAKDSHLHPSRLERFYAEPRVAEFLAWKRRLDPDGLLQTDLYRRVFGPLLAAG